MVDEQPVLGLEVVPCSGCTGEFSSADSPEALEVMAEILPVRVGQRARRTGRRQPLMGCPFLGESSWEQRQVSSEGSRPGTSCQGWMPAYYSVGTRGVVSDGWFGVRGRGGARSGRRLGDL